MGIYTGASNQCLYVLPFSNRKRIEEGDLAFHKVLKKKWARHYVIRLRALLVVELVLSFLLAIDLGARGFPIKPILSIGNANIAAAITIAILGLLLANPILTGRSQPKVSNDLIHNVSASRNYHVLFGVSILNLLACCALLMGQSFQHGGQIGDIGITSWIVVAGAGALVTWQVRLAFKRSG